MMLLNDKCYQNKATPLSGVVLSLYTDVYFVVKPYFVLGYITVNHITNSGKAESGINGEFKII